MTYIYINRTTLHPITLHYITLHYITLHYITSHHVPRLVAAHRRVEVRLGLLEGGEEGELADLGAGYSGRA